LWCWADGVVADGRQILSLVIIQRNADKALRMKEAEDEEQRGRIEEVDESDEEDAAGGGSLGRASPPEATEATETTPLMLEGVGNAWENEGLNGRQREQQERERRPVGN